MASQRDLGIPEIETQVPGGGQETIIPVVDIPIEESNTFQLLASKGDWTGMLETCEKRRWFMRARLFGNEETIFHLAVHEDGPMTLEWLVHMTGDEWGLLEIGDSDGNTPLHLAASMGKTRMVRCLVSKRRELLLIRNKDNEAPLFVAAQSGKKETFLYLFFQCLHLQQGIEYLRGRYGNTILHVAISGGHFDLAFQILKKCKRNAFTNVMNEKGQSPLHLLASNPSAFESGNYLNRLEKVFYNYIPVKKLEESTLKGGNIERTRTESHIFLASYKLCMALIEVIKMIFKVALGYIFRGAQELGDIKRKHTWAVQVLDELLHQASSWEYSGGSSRSDDLSARSFEDIKRKNAWAVLQVLLELLNADSSGEGHGGTPLGPPDDDQLSEGDHPPGDYGTESSVVERESPLLVAAKMGVKEMVQRILKIYPLAIRDVNQDGKNVVLLAVENRQLDVYELLLNEKFEESISSFQQVDRFGNSVLHLAATCKPWLIPGAALQMRTEIKWHQYIKDTLPTKSISRLNKKGQTDKAVFNETHKHLVKQGADWLNTTSQACSVVAALIAAAALATATSFSGGDNQSNKGGEAHSTDVDKRELGVFSIASLIALCFSFASLIVFLSILTSGYQEHGFYKRLTTKITYGLTFLFISMLSILVYFYASIRFVLKHDLNIAIFPVFSITCLPIAYAAVTLFPLYKYLIRSSVYKKPQSIYLSEASLSTSIE